jgi:DNA-binding NarL/FixJ family response regulator
MSEEYRIRVMIVDDHRVVRCRLATILRIKRDLQLAGLYALRRAAVGCE